MESDSFDERARASGPSTHASAVPAFAYAALLLTTLVIKTIVVGSVMTTRVEPAVQASAPATVALVSIVALAIAWLPAVPRFWAAWTVNLLGTAIAIVDLWHVRFYGDVPGVASLLLIRQFTVVVPSALAVSHAADAWVLADLLIVPAVAWIRPFERAPDRRARRVVVRTALAGALLGCGLAAAAFRHDRDGLLLYEFERLEVAASIGIPAYHLYDLEQQARNFLRRRLAISTGDRDRAIAHFTERREAFVQSPLHGVASGSSVLLISAESLHSVAIGLEFQGTLVTPHLTALAKESLHFTDFYDQTHRGSTSSAEFMALNALLPLAVPTVATRYEANRFHSLAHVLGRLGYRTVSAVGDPPGYWNAREIHRRYGFERSRFAGDFAPAEQVGSGLNDASLFAQMVPDLASLRPPFFAFVLSGSNHHPYALRPGLRHLVPEPFPGTMAGDYLQTVRYFDTALGSFLDDLRQHHVLDRTVLVVYGDHRGWLPEADERRLWQLAHPGRTPDAFDLWRLRRGVPLLIRLPGGAAAGKRNVPGGHIDIAPTIAALLGVSVADVPWLGRDLTAPGERLVVLRDGSATDGSTTVMGPGEGLPGCYAGGVNVTCDRAEPLRQQAAAMLAVSDTVITGNLTRIIHDALAAAPRAARALARPLVIAHRGNSAHVPENTLPAIDSALAAGADVVEVDVSLTRDGVAVLFHDAELSLTTSGRGPIAEAPWSLVRRLDAGSWKAPRYRGTRVPTLTEAMRAIRGRGRLYLDLQVEGLAEPVARALAESGLAASEILVAVWTARQRADFRRVLPAVALVSLDVPPDRWSVADAERLRAEGFWGIELTEDHPRACVDAAVRTGMPVFVYTVNSETAMRNFIEQGVTGIETDDPALLRTVVDSYRWPERSDSRVPAR